jgi:tight adherence protein B
VTYIPTLLLCGVVIFGFYLLIDSAIYIIANTGDRGESRRLRRLALDKAAQAQHEYAIEKLMQEEKEKKKLSFPDYIQDLIAKAGSKQTAKRIYLAMVLFGVTALIALLIFAGKVPLQFRIPAAIVIGFFLPILQLKAQASKRINMMADQFPDTLDLMVRSLRIGHPLATALQTVAREMPAPTGPEFEVVARQITYGKTPAEAVRMLSERMPTPDIRFFSVAVQIQHEAGGSLGEILAGLSKIIRSRFQLFRKVTALTAEGRFSAYFLSAFPVVMILAMSILQPGYYDKVADYEFFPQAVAVTAVLLVLNVGAMRMMTKLEV